MKLLKKIGYSFTSMALLAYQSIFAVSQQVVYGPPNPSGFGGGSSSYLSGGIGILAAIGKLIFALCLPILLIVGLVVYMKKAKQANKVVVTLMTIVFVIACIIAIYWLVSVW